MARRSACRCWRGCRSSTRGWSSGCSRPDLPADGPDVAFLGTTDFAVDLGVDAARVRGRVEEIAEAAAAAGVALGASALQDERVSYRLVNSDLALLRTAVANA